jgi:CubicO group peptidase (beta-lactamase class C family)
MTFGWIVGELVRRTDPQRRSLGRIVREEIAAPLGISDLWIGLPDAAEPRVARQIDAMVPVPPEYLPPLFLASMPAAVALHPTVFERPDVRRAEVAGVGGIFNARSEARFWAMLANGGELDGVRLLSREHVASFSTPRANAEEPDPVMFGFPIPIILAVLMSEVRRGRGVFSALAYLPVVVPPVVVAPPPPEVQAASASTIPTRTAATHRRTSTLLRMTASNHNAGP